MGATILGSFFGIRHSIRAIVRRLKPVEKPVVHAEDSMGIVLPETAAIDEQSELERDLDSIRNLALTNPQQLADIIAYWMVEESVPHE